MNINYENWNAFEEGSDQFQYVVDQNPRVSELYVRAKELTQASEFSDDLYLSMWIFRNKVWFTVWPPYQTPDVVEQARQNRAAMIELCRTMESHQADIKTQEIVVCCTLTKVADNT